MQNKEDYHQIEYVGNWKHMTLSKHGKTGSFANLETDTARYMFWGYGLEIRTELDQGHKAYQVLIDGKFIESINVNDSINTTNNLTYSNMELTTGNHVLELVPDGGFFVLNSLTIHYYADPDPIEKCDTVYIYETKLIIDTIYLQPKIFIKSDSIIYELN